MLVTPATAMRTEKLAVAVCSTPYIVQLAYVQRCAAAGAWLAIAPADVPTLDADDFAGASVDFAAVLRARGPLPLRPLAGCYFAFASQFSNNAALSDRVLRLIKTGGGSVELSLTLEFASLHKDSLIVLASKDDTLDRASKGLAAMGVLYHYQLVLTALVRNRVTPADLKHYRIVA